MSKDSQAWRQRIPYLCIVSGGFALRLYRLGAQSLWYDETVSAYLAAQSMPDLIAHTARDIHPPGYYVLLHLWARLAGDTEFALAFFSLICGVLLIPLTYALAGRWLGRGAALWSALLVAISPYHLWYSQEVRMYTLAAVLGLVTLWCALELTNLPSTHATRPATPPQPTNLPTFQPSKRLYIAGYVLASAMGLYVLYYFAFLLVILNIWTIGRLLLSRFPFPASRFPLHVSRFTFHVSRFAFYASPWLLAQALVLLLYLPWLPIAWRQATHPPVPPWRGFIPLPSMLLEAWTALSLGQSVQPGQVWPILLVAGVLLLLGFQASTSKSSISSLQSPTLLAAYTFGPLALIYLVSLAVPLYHVRYLFTYAPPFAMLLGAGLARLWRRARPLAALAALVLLAGSAFSIRELHTNPRYAADDWRAAVRFIAQRWRPGDAILINAGYAYTGFVYYYADPIAGRLRLTDYQPPAGAVAEYPLLLQSGSIGGDPNLGWGDPNADFYATDQVETAAALTRMTGSFPRLWVLRIYDTVTDPDGFIRDWLATNTTPFEDQAFAGEAFMRVQGFMSTIQPPPPQATPIALEGGMRLAGWQAASAARAGGALDVVLWWQAGLPLEPGPGTPYAVSLKLWDSRSPGGASEPHLVAQQDEWPLGSLLFTPAWPAGRPMRHPMRLWLPADLAPGAYRLEVEMYDPSTLQPLPRRDGQGHIIPLGTLTVTSNQQ